MWRLPVPQQCHHTRPISYSPDFSATLHGAKVFSTIDLVRAYHQIPVLPEDVPKTAISTPFGLFEFIRMPFGLKNAAQTFQRFMDQVLRGLDFCYVYIDDILVASASPEEHQRHLRLIFERLTHHGLQSTKMRIWCILYSFPRSSCRQ